MAHKMKVIPRRFWKNIKTGNVASFYGAVPYTNKIDKEEWIIVEDGYSIHDLTNNTIFGNPYKPYKWTHEEAAAVVKQKELR